MIKPLVSIIIPTYNRAYVIKETLESVIEQTYSNWECLVIDDGSTDRTEILVKEYTNLDNRFKYYKRPDYIPSGGNGSRNYGFKLSKGDFINWFDDDDVMLPNFLEEKISNISREINLVITTGYYVNNNLTNRELIAIHDTKNLYKDYVLWHSKILTPSVLFRRDFLINKSLFNLQILRGQETEFFSRLFFNLKPENYKIVNEATFLYRQHDSTKTETNKSFKSEFVDSQVFIAFQNLERGLALMDKEIIDKLSKGIILFMFKNFENKRVNSAYLIGSKLSAKVLKIRPLFAIKIYFSVLILTCLRRSSYRLKSWLINQEL